MRAYIVFLFIACCVLLTGFSLTDSTLLVKTCIAIAFVPQIYIGKILYFIKNFV